MPVKYVKWLVDSYIPGTSPSDALWPAASYQAEPVEQILVLEHGPNPSSDYYIKPRLKHGDISATFVDISSQRPEQFTISEGTFVVIVRYLNRSWGNHLFRHQHLLRGVAFFMDDDLIGAKNATHLPLRYRHKIHTLFERQLDQLNGLCSELWVSTPRLAEQYAHCAPRVIPPLPLNREASSAPPLTYFYHGSASHQAEIAWLYDVVAQVQSSSDRLNFMIIGGGEVHRLFKALPRITVLHPLSWQCYLHGLTALPHHIGLVPLLPDSFNNVRSHTKFFDLTRLGSVGIYSDTVPYSHFVRDGVDGLLLKNDPKLWATTIIRLSENSEQRNELLTQARIRVEKLTSQPSCLLSKKH